MSGRDSLRASAVRWLKFNAVGVIGIGVQLDQKGACLDVIARLEADLADGARRVAR